MKIFSVRMQQKLIISFPAVMGQTLTVLSPHFVKLMIMVRMMGNTI